MRGSCEIFAEIQFQQVFRLKSSQ